MTIPIRNVYYLFSYAWDQIGRGGPVDVGVEELARMEDLFGHLLASALGQVVRQGLYREYREEREELRGVRGRLAIGEMVKRGLGRDGRAICDLDDLAVDVLHNRIVKSTVSSLAAVPSLDSSIRARLHQLRARMVGVRDVVVRASDFRRAHVHRHNGAYRFLMSICRLIYDSIQANQELGTVSFLDWRTDEVWMWQLFQSFVTKFLQREQCVFEVSPLRVDWVDVVGSKEDLELLPAMWTDAVLRSPGRTVVVDTKYYQQALAGKGETDKVRSEHLYQLFAYLQNWPACAGGVKAEGMLLYPRAETTLRLDYVLKGHRVQVVTLNLAADWKDIHEELLALVA